MGTWLITGCSTGLGRAFAEEVLDRGHNAVVTARDASAVGDLVEAHPGTALALALDVTDPARVSEVTATGRRSRRATTPTSAGCSTPTCSARSR